MEVTGSVRPMRFEERGVVLSMMREVWGEAGESDFDDATVFVWDHRGGVGGFVSVSIRPWAEGCTSAPVPYVEGWFVAPDLRRSGAGRALLDAAEQWARAAGFTEIGSDARLDNTVSLRAHRRLGFAPTERLQYFRKSLVGAANAAGEIHIETYTGPRRELRGLFELAEDSAAELDSYLHAGRVLVALSGADVIGHLQLVDTDDPKQVEIKNMAVREAEQGRGVGSRLIQAAVDLVTGESATTLIVATAAADIDNLRFYQRQGFRMRSIERDAFTTATGYPPGIRIDGIELRDRVWLDRPVGPATP